MSKLKYSILMAPVMMVGVQAEAKYAQIKSCGKAKVSAGDTCSNVKVNLDLSDCEVKEPSVDAKKIICEGNNIKIRYSKDDYRYETQFEKVDDGWGSVEWKYIGSVKQWQKEKPVAVVKPVKPTPKVDIAKVDHDEKIQRAINSSPEAPSVAPVTPPPVASAPSATKISGFVDFRLTNYSEKTDSVAKNTNPESGFAMEDGAIYITHEAGALSFLVDAPFRRYKNSDNGAYSGSQPNASANGNFLFGGDKAQAYAKYKANDYVNLWVGQFDTPYGVELNDSKDRYFGKTGLVYDQFLPVTHAGALVEVAHAGAYFKAFSANPNNKGSLGESTAGDVSYEYGALGGWGNDNWRAQVGYLTRGINKADGTTGGSRDLLDVTAGTTWGAVSVDVEYSMLTDSSKNTLTPTDTADKEKAATGFLGRPAYRKALEVGGPFELMR